ncbi:MAG: flavin reductase family protein [Blautia massiliensis (ex Durand et al. 2017)]|uniref:flavin reductase family protein n=1 Tax=Blautia massiliensis (ex Durand et al. 2017) TaxID=1737424 RepID=UPI00399C4E49
MAKQLWKPGNMIYPLPAVMVSVTDGEGNDNIITVAWTGTVCTNPAMAYISVRPSRYSYDMIRKTGEFVINLTTEKLAYATDFCGVRSGRDVDKFRKLNLTKEKAQFVSAPMIGEAPVSIECRVREVKELGSHDMFLADVLAVHADEAYMDKNNRFRLNDAGLLVYSHGEYLAGGRKVGTFGYSVKRRSSRRSRCRRSWIRNQTGKQTGNQRRQGDVRKARDVREIKDVGKGRERETVGSAEL